MTRRHFAKCLAAGILGVPMLRPKPNPWLEQELADLKILREYQHHLLFDYNGEELVRIPNWFGPGKDAYFRTLNGMVREFETEMRKVFPEQTRKW